MGSFNQACSLSGLNINWNEPCYAVLLSKQRNLSKDEEGGVFEPQTRYQVASPFLKAEYYDYGYSNILDEWDRTELEKFYGFDLYKFFNGEEGKRGTLDVKLGNTMFIFYTGLIHPAVHEVLNRPYPSEFGPTYEEDMKDIEKSMSSEWFPKWGNRAKTFHVFSPLSGLYHKSDCMFNITTDQVKVVRTIEVNAYMANLKYVPCHYGPQDDPNEDILGFWKNVIDTYKPHNHEDV